MWYEIELYSSRFSEEYISHDLWLSFSKFCKIKWQTAIVKMSLEHYRTTIEFNFLKEKFTLNLHKKVKKFIKMVIKKYKFKVYWRCPAFVWTHIHFFRSELNSLPRDSILHIVLLFIIENIDDLHIRSIERIICSHQLRGHYAHENQIFHKLLWKLWKGFLYKLQSIDRPKYRPVIHSPRNVNWKLRSTEIRLIPTEFILNDKILILINILKTMTPIPNPDIPQLYTSLIDIYICKIWKIITKN